MITGSPILLFLFQRKNENVDLFIIGSLIFGIQNKIPSDLLCPTILILPHPTLIFLQWISAHGLWCKSQSIGYSQYRAWSVYQLFALESLKVISGSTTIVSINLFHDKRGDCTIFILITFCWWKVDIRVSFIYFYVDLHRFCRVSTNDFYK